MPAAALVKGILLSLGVLAALGFAAYENPEVQQWIDEQRRRLADLLRGIGEELDPQSRREAEAFVYQGRSPPQEESTAQSTGAEVQDAAVRRVPVQGRLSEADTEERQRLGREYLAARNQLLRVMRQRRDGASSQTMSEQPQSEVDEIKQEPEAQEAPPLPPKVKLEELEPTPWTDSEPSQSMPGAFEQAEETSMPGAFEPEETPGMTYEEQLAHAISLSEQDSKTAAQAYDDDVRRAVEASLRDFSSHVPSAPPVDARTIDLLSDDLPRANVWSQDEDLYNVTPSLTRATLAAFKQQPPQPELENPFEDAGEQISTVTSWTLEGDEEKAAPAEESDDEAGVVTPDSWTEVGSLPGEAEPERQLA